MIKIEKEAVTLSAPLEDDSLLYKSSNMYAPPANRAVFAFDTPGASTYLLTATCARYDGEVKTEAPSPLRIILLPKILNFSNVLPQTHYQSQILVDRELCAARRKAVIYSEYCPFSSIYV
jgi:hypothetical protein